MLLSVEYPAILTPSEGTPDSTPPLLHFNRAFVPTLFSQQSIKYLRVVSVYIKALFMLHGDILA